MFLHKTLWSLKKHNWVWVPRCVSFFFFFSFFCLFEALQCPFSKFGASFIPSFVTIILYSLFVSLDNASPLIHFHACISHYFLLMITMFNKYALQARYFDFIPNQPVSTYWSLHSLLGLPILILRTCRQTLSVFDSVRNHMIDLTSAWKIRGSKRRADMI